MRKHLKYLKKEKGMTLVELLAVLVILAIIAAIAIPLISGQIQKSKEQSYINEALNIISAAKLKYAQEGFGKDGKEAAPTYTITSGNNVLSGYIDIKVEKDVTVKLSGNIWSISGHPAVKVVTNDSNGSVTESQLRSKLKE
ncbi:prepilin-type N-terminal cleavage/methylation domain-containing protein [Pallidibacillus pasinlerensis]|uniref:Prepilin-type N-terminal cleavage/methylation domain-containing protein n=1 Tax=Pallidibacillus pasinlerensis TaxID=2703818 RepID=A0ABX0A0K8_9BACI|nr:prepilin-type N-terminal cleavage/methylation domain-containing protein [Pallidibacillus pasinlerensis]NCU16939.1 prepilin-type N-terminal cleavage/methylation domain-containing protein [Pallidibacillus pasinlerensis]